MPIYIAFYHDFSRQTDSDGYVPIQVGCDRNTTKLDMIGDNTGDHISDQNQSFNELTALYWAWKNTSDPVVGLCHYRRFFIHNPTAFWQSILFKYTGYASVKKLGIPDHDYQFNHLIVSYSEITRLLDSFDLLVPRRRRLNYSVEKHYYRYHHGDDLLVTKKVLARRAPEYLDTFEQVLSQSCLYLHNMFVAKRPLFEQYMEWVFPILFDIDDQIERESRTDYNKRIIGFLHERIFTTWIIKNKINVKELQLGVFY